MVREQETRLKDENSPLARNKYIYYAKTEISIDQRMRYEYMNLINKTTK